MITWALIIFILDAILYYSLVSGKCGQQCSLFFCIGIAVAALGILIRTFVKIRAGRFEQMDKELRRMKDDNKELLERISNIREQQIIDRTDKDLI